MNYETKRRLMMAGWVALSVLTSAGVGYGTGKIASSTAAPVKACPVCPQCPTKVEAEITKPLKIELYDLRQKK